MRFFLFDTFIRSKLWPNERLAQVRETMSTYGGGVFGHEWSAWMEENIKGEWELYITNLFDKGGVRRYTLFSVYLVFADEPDALMYMLKYGETSRAGSDDHK